MKKLVSWLFWPLMILGMSLLVPKALPLNKHGIKINYWFIVLVVFWGAMFVLSWKCDQWAMKSKKRYQINRQKES